MTCDVLPGDGNFASSLIAYADCQARTIGEQGYLALSANASSVSELLSVLLTILVALAGYRLLLGNAPTIREAVLTLVKIGVVMAFATGWPAYRIVVYDVAILAPGELGATIGGAAGLAGGNDALGQHLDAVDGQFQLLALENASQPLVDQGAGAALPQLFAGFNTFALGGARIIYLTGTVGSFVVTRLLAGILLALGPLFIAFLLFDATRGLVEGWLRALSAAAVGTLAASLVAGVEVALLGPWLASLITQRAAGVSIAAAAGQLFAAATLFALASGTALAAAARLTWGIRLPRLIAAASTTALPQGERPYPATAGASGLTTIAQGPGRSRALAIADAVSALDRREATALRGAPQLAPASIFTSARLSWNAPIDVASARSAGRSSPVGMTSRRGLSRRSASAQRRDRTP